MKAKNPLSLKIAGIKFPNPVLTASGTFGYGQEFEQFYKVNRLGGIVSKTITLKPRLGNPPKRVAETPGGMLNAIGLQNVGVERFCSEKMPYLKKLGIPVIVSVMGYSIDEFKGVITRLESQSGIDGYELNLSCPNVAYGSKKKTVKMFAHDAKMIRQVVASVRKLTKRAVFAKLGPDVSDIGEMAAAAEKGGADAVSLINTFRAMAINLNKREPLIRNVTAGLSGPCIKPIALRMVWDAYQALRIPVIGMGGISNTEDALEFMVCGSSLIQVGTMNFIRPTICPEIIKGMQSYLRKNKINSVKKLIGSLNV